MNSFHAVQCSALFKCFISIQFQLVAGITQHRCTMVFENNRVIAPASTGIEGSGGALLLRGASAVNDQQAALLIRDGYADRGGGIGAFQSVCLFYLVAASGNQASLGGFLY